MKTLKIKFFSLSDEELGKVEEFYEDRGLLHRVKNENFYENIFEIQSFGEEFEKFIPPFALPKYVGMGGQKIEDYLKELAIEKKATLSVAESCTGGLIANRITDISGSSLYFTGGVVAYSNSMKTLLLRVRKESIIRYGAVSPEVVREMADGMAAISGAEYVVSTSGIAGPDGGSKEKPVGTVWFGIRTPYETETQLRRFTGRREEIKFKASSFAIFDLIRVIRMEGGR